MHYRLDIFSRLFPVYLFLLLIGACAERVTLSSSSGLLAASVYADTAKGLSYSLQLNGKTIVEPSSLGITVDGINLGQGVHLGDPVYSVTNEKYAWKGVHDTAINYYRQVIIPVVHLKSGIHFQVELRIFDDGLAYRYVVPSKKSTLITGEASSWKIPNGSMVWYQENVYYYEGLHYSAPISQLGIKILGPPVTYRTPDGLYASITEAALYSYSGMSLKSDSNHTFHANFVNDAAGWRTRDTVISPWRVVMASPDLNGLVNSDVIGNLNPAPDSVLQHADWIKPGRAVWSYFTHDNVTTLALEKTFVDKAALLGFEYSIVDAGWESSWPNKLDSLRSLADYARNRGVGLFIWKSYASLKNDTARRDFFSTMHEIGVKGLKIDYIDKEGIAQVKFYENALKDAAAVRLMIDFHGSDKPTGYNRRYPNEITREGIYGQEWRTFTPQGPANNATIPFTRFLAGPGDYTPGVFDSRIAYGSSRTHQLALPVIYNSPLMCWADDPAVYLESPAVSMIRSIPTVWDETIVLPESRIGQVAAFARRKAADWFIGIINAGPKRQFKISLRFLKDGNYQSTLFQDDLTNSDHFFQNETNLTAADSLTVTMRPDGGYAAMFKKTGRPLPSISIIPEGGYLKAPARVEIKGAADLQIRYTTDGTEPGPASTLYIKPMITNKPLLIKAVVIEGGKTIASTALAQFLLAPAPLVSPPGGIFTDSQQVTIFSELQEGDIRYTLDGKVPTNASILYQHPFMLAQSANLKTGIFFKSGNVSGISTRLFKQVMPEPALASTNTLSGLTYFYYEGKWKSMPDFPLLASLKKGVTARPDLAVATPGRVYYAFQFFGFVNIPRSGVYTFYIVSDDGSQLYINNKKLIDNDGCHGDLEKSGECALAAGLHAITLNYFQAGSGQTLQIFMEGPGLPKKEIPASMFFH